MSQDPYKYFRIEARELLEQLGKGVLELEKGPPPPDLVQRLLRLAHTLKGAARVVRQTEIAERAHAIEDLLAALKQVSAAVPRDQASVLLTQLDAIGARVRALDLAPETDASMPPPMTLSAEDLARTVKADVAEVDALLDRILEIGSQILSMRQVQQEVERARNLSNSLTEQVALFSSHGDRSGTALAKLEGLAQDLRAAVHTAGRGFAGGLDQVERDAWQLREAAEQLRLISVGTVFNELERMVRDAAGELSREVRFEAVGYDVRLDSHVLSVIRPALVQLVRNAVAHGIEPNDERERAGKPPEGRIFVHVHRRNDRIIFNCEDDGRGLDTEAVRRAAQERGFSRDKVARLGAEELFQMLLRGGLTTSGTVTEVAGRGVGLDVVREAVSGLGGEIAIRTEAGKGMSVELAVAAARAGMKGLVVEASGLSAVIPLGHVRRTVRLKASEVTRNADGEMILHETQVIPFVPLAALLRARQQQERKEHWSAVVVESGSEMVAVGVDRLIGTTGVVVRPLPSLAPAAAIVAGMSLDAQGLPQVVLSPEAVVAASRDAKRLNYESPEKKHRILVVDDSLTTRMLEQSILESAGYEVDLAISGEEGLQRARKGRYEVFLVDVEMPGMDGFAFVESAQADPVLREVPSILVTSRSSPSDRKRGEEVGAVAYVVKSEFNQEELLATIRRLLRDR